MTKIVKAKVRIVNLDGISKEEFAEQKLKELKGSNFQLKKKWKGNHLNYLLEEYFEEFCLNVHDETDENLYEFLELEEIEPCQLFSQKTNEDGSVSFLIGFNDSSFGVQEVVNEIFDQEDVPLYTK